MESELYVKGEGKELLIVSFGGYSHAVGGIQPFEFLNFLDKNFKSANKLFYKDLRLCSYHKGIEGISNNIEETVEYIKMKIKDYNKTLFIGNSGGGYASLLFGSLLKVNYVLAFVPQTILSKPDKEEKYKNIKPFINPETIYHVYGDISIRNVNDHHHISHCENLNGFKNVIIFKQKVWI